MIHGYHPLDALLEEAARLARPVKIGRSARGEPLRAFRTGGDGPCVLYLANLHALEWIGAEVALALLAELRERPTDREVWVVPVVNLDGRRDAEADRLAGRRRFRRTNARGVDLNRNFGVHFDARHWLSRVLPPVYAAGPAPLSEPETAALAALCDEHPPRYACSLHSFGRRVFYPWAARAERPPDADELARTAAALAERMPHERYRHGQLGRFAFWFSARGAEIDHLYGRHGTRAFLVEVSGGGLRAGRPATWLDPLAWFNPPDPRAESRNLLPALRLLCEL